MKPRHKSKIWKAISCSKEAKIAICGNSEGDISIENDGQDSVRNG